MSTFFICESNNKFEMYQYGLSAQHEIWTCSNKDYQLLNSRLIHINMEDARQHADVLNKIHGIK